MREMTRSQMRCMREMTRSQMKCTREMVMAGSRRMLSNKTVRDQCLVQSDNLKLQVVHILCRSVEQ